jgi:protein-tyrosine phosphatase
MNNHEPFVDIHCHMLPALDDGPQGWDEAVAMAEIAMADGIAAIVVTPHQLGNYSLNTPDQIVAQTDRFRQTLKQRAIRLQLFPGADVRIDPELSQKVQIGEVLTLADRHRHLLLELPHEVYISLDGLLKQLRANDIVGILSHPERNRGIISQPNILRSLAEQGCLLQITAGSVLGKFGWQSQKLAEWMIEQGLAHFIATDAHGLKSRTPVLSHAFQRVTELSSRDNAIDLCCRNPACVIAGIPIVQSRETHRKHGNSVLQYVRF